VNNTQSNDELVEQIFLELERLLPIKLHDYINQHFEGSKFKFINEFIVFPTIEYSPDDTECYDEISEPLAMASRLNNHLSLPIDITVTSIFFEGNGDLTYEFKWLEFESEPINDVSTELWFELSENKIRVTEFDKKKISEKNTEKLHNILWELKMV
jgi:hypothetical protein